MSEKRVHVYGRPWLWLGNLGLGATDVAWMGLVLAAAFMVCAVLLLAPVDLRTLALCAGILFSPAISLAVERGNNDVLVFLCLIFAAWLVTRPTSYHTGGYWTEGAPVRQLAAILIVFGLVALKFYPIVVFAALAIAARGRREFAITVVGGSVLIAIWLFFAWSDLVVLRGRVPRPEGQFATGGTLLYKYICPTCRIFVLSLATAAISGLVAAAWAFRRGVADLTVSSRAFVLYLIGWLVLVSTFMANTNYDYRWIFFLCLVPALREIYAASSGSRRVIRICFASVLVVMWAELVRFNLDLLTLTPTWMGTADHAISIAKAAAAWVAIISITALGFELLRTSQSYIGAAVFEWRSKWLQV